MMIKCGAWMSETRAPEFSDFPRKQILGELEE